MPIKRGVIMNYYADHLHNFDPSKLIAISNLKAKRETNYLRHFVSALLCGGLPGLFLGSFIANLIYAYKEVLFTQEPTSYLCITLSCTVTGTLLLYRYFLNNEQYLNEEAIEIAVIS